MVSGEDASRVGVRATARRAVAVDALQALPHARRPAAPGPDLYAADRAAPLRAAVTRTEHVSRIRTALDDGRSVLVVGDAGVGKTHLLSQALRSTTAPVTRSVVTISGASARNGIPLAALEPLLGDDGLLAMGSFARTVGALAASLRERSADGPVLLRVEDAHLLDEASGQALAWVVRQGDVQLAATARRSASAASPWLELWKDDVVERVDLPPFTLPEVERWLAAELGGQVTSDTVRQIWGESGGNAFYLRELVRTERETGCLRRHGDVWIWAGQPLPGQRLLDLVGHDTGRLGTDARAALEVAALVCPVSLSVLLDVVPRAAVDELAHAGIVTMVSRVSGAGASDVVVDMAHGLYADAVRSSVPRARRREVLERALRTQHEVGTSPASLVRSVSLALDSEVPVPFVRVRAAVDAAFALQQTTTAARLATAALRYVEPGSRQWADLLLLRSDAWRHVGNPARSLQDVEELSAVLRTMTPVDDGLVERVIDAAELRAAVTQYHESDLDAALAVLDEAEEWLTVHAPHQAWRRDLRVVRLTRLAYGGRVHEHLDEAMDLLADPAVPTRLVRLVCPVVFALAQSGRTGDGMTLCARWAPVALATADRYRWGAGEIVIGWFLSALWSGEVEGAQAMTERGDLHDESPLTLDWVAAHVARGMLAAARGSWSISAAEFHAANARFDISDMGGVAIFTTLGEALAAAANGQVGTARALLAQAERFPLRAMASLQSEVRLMRVDTLAWLHDPRARQEAAELARWSRERGQWRTELEALHRLVERGGRATGARTEPLLARVRELGALVQGPRAAALVQHVEALAAGDRDLVGIAERELNRCGLWLPPVELPAVLTPREREIAGLAAGGMTSRAIAQRLTLSVRTVDSHLARVFAKTGVHSREGLSAVLR